jgi:hypothetical protein
MNIQGFTERSIGSEWSRVDEEPASARLRNWVFGHRSLHNVYDWCGFLDNLEEMILGSDIGGGSTSQPSRIRSSRLKRFLRILCSCSAIYNGSEVASISVPDPRSRALPAKGSTKSSKFALRLVSFQNDLALELSFDLSYRRRYEMMFRSELCESHEQEITNVMCP